MKKTLVYHTGRAPDGVRTNWVTNMAYCSPSDLFGYGIPDTNLFLAQVADTFVISLASHDAIRNGQIALNGIQCRIMKVSIGDAIPVTRFIPPENFNLALLTLELEFLKKGKNEQIDVICLSNQIKTRFKNHILTVGQRVTFEYLGNNYIFTVNQAVLEGQDQSSSPERGMISSDTYIVFEAPNASGIKASFD